MNPSGRARPGAADRSSMHDVTTRPASQEEDGFATLEPGTPMLGKYVIERLLGRGGSSTVYAARHVLLERTVALKVLRNLPDGGTGRARLLREARLLANLLHPNVVKIFEHGVVNGDTAFLALELLEPKNAQLRSKVLFLSADILEREKKWDRALVAWQAYVEQSAKLGPDGGAFPQTGAARIKAIQRVIDLEKSYAAVRQRIQAEKDAAKAAPPKK